MYGPARSAHHRRTKQCAPTDIRIHRRLWQLLLYRIPTTPLTDDSRWS